MQQYQLQLKHKDYKGSAKKKRFKTEDMQNFLNHPVTVTKLKREAELLSSQTPLSN